MYTKASQDKKRSLYFSDEDETSFSEEENEENELEDLDVLLDDGNEDEMEQEDYGKAHSGL